jgi:hypothetical protein
MPKDTQALALLTAKSEPTRSLLPQMPGLITGKLEAIRRHDVQAAQLSLQIGVLLWQTKATLPHGEFQAWIKSNVDGRGYRVCAYYMKLALAFTEKVKPAAWKIEAMMTLDFDATKHTDEELSALDTMKQFIGENSITELLIKHGIKSVGLKSELADGQEPPALTGEQQLELDWAQAYEPAKSLADLLAEKAAAFTSEQRAALEAELKRALEAIRAA